MKAREMKRAPLPGSEVWGDPNQLLRETAYNPAYKPFIGRFGFVVSTCNIEVGERVRHERHASGQGALHGVVELVADDSARVYAREDGPKLKYKQRHPQTMLRLGHATLRPQRDGILGMAEFTGVELTDAQSNVSAAVDEVRTLDLNVGIRQYSSALLLATMLRPFSGDMAFRVPYLASQSTREFAQLLDVDNAPVKRGHPSLNPMSIAYLRQYQLSGVETAATTIPSGEHYHPPTLLARAQHGATLVTNWYLRGTEDIGSDL